MTYEGYVKDGVIVLDPAVKLPEGSRVRIEPEEQRTLEDGAESMSSLARMLLKHAGTVHGLPADFSENHDHYLYGAPKKQ